MEACSLPLWFVDQDRDGDSSVSSGRLSGSSGGHESSAPPHGPWRERPPQILGPQRQPRKSDPRLEQLRDKIRAQAQWQASCASLGTSAPSSASHLCKASSPTLWRKTRKGTHSLPAPARPGCSTLHVAEPRTCDKVLSGLGRELSRVTQHKASVPREKTKRIKNSSWKREKAPRSPSPSRAGQGKDSELVGVHAWRKGQALVRQLLGPPPTRPRLQSKAPTRDRAPAVELGDCKKAAAAERSAVHTWTSRPASARSGQQLSEDATSLASRDQPATIQSALAVLQDLREQIQAGLELARSPRGLQRLRPTKGKPQNLAGRRQQGTQSSRDLQGSFSKSPWTVVEGKGSSSGRGRSSRTQKPWSTLAEWESYPQSSRVAQGLGPSFQRLRSCAEKLDPFSRRPWSTWSGQACAQRAWAASEEDWETSDSSPWSSAERPRPVPQRPQSSSFVQRTGPPFKGRAAVPQPLRVKQAWSRPPQGLPQDPQGQDGDMRSPPPCLQPQGPLSQPYSLESLRNLAHKKVQAQRQQALEQKALATRTLELRNQRLQEVYRKQREAVLSRAVPVVSQTSPGIVTFVPSTARSGGLASPEQQWNKVTSGTVLGNQEAPGSFCLCLNRAWNHTETLETGSGAPLLLPTSSSLGPLQLQDLPQGLCVYLDPQEADGLGSSGPLHFQYKQARLQALETMANVLKQRIDILTTKLHGAEAADAAMDLPPWGPSAAPATLTLTAPACPGTLLPNRDTRVPQGWVGMQAQPLVHPTWLLDDDPLLWSPSWELQSQGVEEGHWELDKQLQRDTGSSRALSALTGSSCGVPSALDPTCSSLCLEDVPSARGASLLLDANVSAGGDIQARALLSAESVAQRAAQAARAPGQQEPGGLCSGDPHSGYLADLQQKSSSFLESLKLDQQKQEQALALLQQRAKHEVWETQMALDGLQFKHQLKQLMEHSAQARPEAASKPQQLQICEGPAPPSARAPTPQGGDAARSPQGPEEGQSEAPAEMQPPDPDPAASQLPLARLCSLDSHTHQRSTARLRSARAIASRATSRFTVRMLEQSLREEELRAQHQAALLRLREMALEEKARAEMAWLEHQRGCLGSSEGHQAAQEALLEKQQLARSRLEKEQSDIQQLRNFHLSMHQDRKQLLQHQKDLVTAQSTVAHLQQELQSWTQVPQNSSPAVKATREEGSETSQQLEEGLCPLTELSLCLQRSPERSKVIPLPSGQQEGTPSETAFHADGHLQPPRSAWGEDTAKASSPLVESGHHMDQGRGCLQAEHVCDSQDCLSEPGAQPCVPLRSLLHSTSLIRQPPGPGSPAMEAEGSTPTAQLRPQEAKGPPAGDPQTKPRSPLAEESPPALTDRSPWSLEEQSQQPRGREGCCSPQEARVAESDTSGEGSEWVLAVAGSPVGETQEAESCQLGKQRKETFPQEDIGVPFPGLDTTQLAASPAAPAAPEEEVPALSGIPLSQLGALLDLDLESALRTCSGSSEAPASSPTSSAGSASDLTCSSLQEFQKVTASLVQLSDSSLSLSGLEAEVTPDADLSQAGGCSAQDSWEELSPPLTRELHQGAPRLGNVPGGAGCMPWQRWEGSRDGPLGGSSVEGGPESRESLLQAAWPLPLPDAPSPRSGSELSEVSNQIWDEDSKGSLQEVGMSAEPALGSSWPASGSNLENSGQAQVLLPLLGPGEGQESSGASKSLTSGSDSGGAKQASLEEPCKRLWPQALPTRDPDSFASARCFSRERRRPPQALGGCQEGPWGADLSLSTKRTLPQTSPGPEVPSGLDTLATESQVPGCRGQGAPAALEEAGPPCDLGCLAEIWSPVCKELSYDSRDLLSPTNRDAHLPPPPPAPGAKSNPEEACPSSEDFPTPPEEAMLSGGSLGPLGEDTSIASEDLSEEPVPESLSPGTQKLGLHVGEPGQGRRLEGKLCELSSVMGSQAMGRQGSGRILVGLDGSLLRGAAASPAPWPAAPAASSPGPVPLVASDQAGSLSHIGEEGEEGLSCRAENQPGAKASLDREQLPGRGSTAVLASGPCAGNPGLEGGEGAKAVDLVSTRLTRRILSDLLAVLSGLAPRGSP